VLPKGVSAGTGSPTLVSMAALCNLLKGLRTSGTSSGLAGVEGRSHSKGRRVSVVDRRVHSCAGGIAPDYADCVPALIVGKLCLAEEIYWPRSCDIDLFRIVAGQDQDVMGHCVVW